MKYIKIF
jgi:hypothetical protein